jgi:hypothetical protein
MEINRSLAPLPLTLAGHTVALHDRAGGILNLRVALGGGSLVTLARELSKLDGVRVTSGPPSPDRQRCYLVHCPGFKLILSTSGDTADDFAVALVSRAPQATLAVTSDLATILERLMSEPPKVVDPPPSRTRSTLQKSALQQNKPLVRRGELRRKTPLARGRWNSAPSR